MKIMNKSISIFATLFVAMFLFSCGEKQTLKMWQIIDESQDVTNQGEGTVDITVLKGELQSALYDEKGSVVATSAHGYQYSNANTVDVFAGYTTVSRSDFQYGPALFHTYQWPNGYYGSACSVGPTSALYNTYTYAESLGVPEYKAIAQIIYAQTALHAVNNAGCVPYDDNRKLKVSRPLTYYTQEDTYDAILADLNEAIETLSTTTKDAKEALLEVEGEAKDKGDVDFAYSEYSWEKWIKLANSVKLRIAMYLSKPDPEQAKQVAEEAIAGGLLDEDFGPRYKQGNTQHPYYQISASNDGGWADSRMNASLENILKRTGSPLIEKYFKKNLDKVTNKVDGSTTKKDADYYGIRQGTNVGIKTSGQGYYNFSEASVAFKYIRQVWITKEEVIFMKAEAALRWGLGDKSAKEYYEEGIRSIFAKFDLSSKVDAYLAQKSVVQQKKGGKFYDIDYVDILDAKNNLPGRLNICVAWDESDSDETKLEKIITQKWISIYPNGNEAWVDYRRTGYPRLFPSVQPWQGVPSFPVELQLRRIPHDESDENILLYDLPNIEQALSIYGEKGKNAGGQRLYFEGDPAEYPYVYDEVTGWPIPKNF